MHRLSVEDTTSKGTPSEHMCLILPTTVYLYYDLDTFNLKLSFQGLGKHTNGTWR